MSGFCRAGRTRRTPETAEDIMRTRVPEIVAILLLVGFLATPHLGVGREATRAPLPGASTADRAQDQLDFANGLYQREMFLEAAAEYGTFVKTYGDHGEIPVALFRRAECLYQASYQTQTESLC